MIAVEFLEFELQQAFPGLTAFDYQMIAEQSNGDLRKAMADAKSAHLTMLAHKNNQAVADGLEDAWID